MRRVATTLARVWRAGDTWLLVEAALALAIARLALAALPFRAVLRVLRLLRDDRSPASQPAVAAIDRVAGAVTAVAGRLPWRSTCLVRSLAISSVLARRGMPCGVCLGVAKDLDGRVIAHAWVRCGDHVIDGDPTTRFVAIAAFSSRAGWWPEPQR